MNNKKGFTLIEIIVCISLLTVIAITVVVSINNNKKENEEKREKIISEIKTVANVYLSTNDVSSELKDNSYMILYVQEIIDKGLLKESDIINPTTEKSILLENNYDKMLVYKTKLNNYEIKYPYEDPGAFLNMTPLETYKGVKNIVCEKGLTLNNIKELECSPNYFKNGIGIDNTIEKINYSYINEKGLYIETERIISIKDIPTPTITLEEEKEWYNEDVSLQLDKNGCEECNLNVNDNITLNNNVIISNTGTTNVKNCLIDNETVCSANVNKEIKIDKIKPTISSLKITDKNNYKIEFIAKDSESGIKAYTFSKNINIDYNSSDWVEVTTPNKITISKELPSSGVWYVYVKDIAGNINFETINVPFSIKEIILNYSCDTSSSSFYSSNVLTGTSSSGSLSKCGKRQYLGGSGDATVLIKIPLEVNNEVKKVSIKERFNNSSVNNCFESDWFNKSDKDSSWGASENDCQIEGAYCVYEFETDRPNQGSWCPLGGNTYYFHFRIYFKEDSTNDDIIKRFDTTT